MNTFLTKAMLGATLGATALTAAAPAEAQYYRRHRDNDAGTAIVAGVAGLAIGAAIASSANRDRYYDDRYYYNNDYNYRYNNYNYPRYNNYYNNDYYYQQRCRVERRYDPYYNRTVRVRVCY